ncbi:MAG: histidine phosphotransferase family protein [Janthinobacterium lividum]
MSIILKLTQALNSKLCHDMSGLVGAITTGMELANSADLVIKDGANQILSTAPGELYNLMNFYRMVYGFSAESDTIYFSKIKDLCNNIIDKKIEFELSAKSSSKINRSIGQLIICLVVSASKNILKDGAIKVDIEKNSDYIVVAAHGKYLKREVSRIVTLSVQEELNIYNVHEYYTFYLSKILDFRISVDQLETQIRYTASYLGEHR